MSGKKANERLMRCRLCHADYLAMMPYESGLCPDCDMIERMSRKNVEANERIELGKTPVERLDRAEIEQAFEAAGHPIISAEFRPVSGEAPPVKRKAATSEASRQKVPCKACGQPTAKTNNDTMVNAEDWLCADCTRRFHDEARTHDEKRDWFERNCESLKGHEVGASKAQADTSKATKPCEYADLPDEVADSQRFAVPDMIIMSTERFSFLDCEKIAREAREMASETRDDSTTRYIKRRERSAAISTVALVVSVLAMLLTTAILDDWSGFVYVASTTAVVCTWLGQASRALIDRAHARPVCGLKHGAHSEISPSLASVGRRNDDKGAK